MNIKEVMEVTFSKMMTTLPEYDKELIVAAIKEEIEKALEQQKQQIKANIPFLCQWLNEHPSELIMNKAIEAWLFDSEQEPVCDGCGKHKRVGEYQGKKLCQDCWAKTLTDEEISNL